MSYRVGREVSMPQEFPNGLTQGMLNQAESAICSSLFCIEGRDTVGTLQNAAGPILQQKRVYKRAKSATPDLSIMEWP